MSKKKMSLGKIFLIFFVVHIVLALFMSKSIVIGEDPETGKMFSLVEKGTTMQDDIGLSIQPDKFVIENNIENPEQFTWGSKKIYDFFDKFFGKIGATNWFAAPSTIVNFQLWRTLFFINIFFIVLAIYLRKQLSFIPSKAQIIVEFLWNFLDDLVEETLGAKNKKFTPFFVTLFIFILISNWSGFLPIPGISEPTKNLNVPLGLGIMSLGMVQVLAVKKKGILQHLKGFCEPVFILFPLNVVGELSKLISISFRLFGNIFGGAIIATVISALTMYVILPVGLTMFFTLFAGTIQAFVFTMLSLTYLSLEIGEDA
ncbi:MAG: F0F1 ATP synthase subunit A [Candidatus Cloacimonetes bacterium]|nr:F0F1 ATP synthase subunit A [Candidatus Cloacimonadota bacterium]